MDTNDRSGFLSSAEAVDEVESSLCVLIIFRVLPGTDILGANSSLMSFLSRAIRRAASLKISRTFAYSFSNDAYLSTSQQ